MSKVAKHFKLKIIFHRDRESIAANKKEIETQLNEVLTESKKHAIVANNVFHAVQVFDSTCIPKSYTVFET